METSQSARITVWVRMSCGGYRYLGRRIWVNDSSENRRVALTDVGLRSGLWVQWGESRARPKQNHHRPQIAQRRQKSLRRYTRAKSQKELKVSVLTNIDGSAHKAKVRIQPIEGFPLTLNRGCVSKSLIDDLEEDMRRDGRKRWRDA